MSESMISFFERGSVSLCSHATLMIDIVQLNGSSETYEVMMQQMTFLVTLSLPELTSD